MENVEVVSVWKQAKSLAIVIPKEIAEQMNIEVGDKLVMRVEGGELRIKKLEWR
jgi:AbrB family looped-hinge helix DNA binding protein